MAYHLYPLEDQSRLPEICELFAKGLGETTVEYWKWKHFSENGMPDSLLIAAEDDGGKIVGMYALQPTWYRKGKERLLIVQTEDLVIDNACRGSGLMKTIQTYMTDYYTSQGADGWVAYANPISFIIFQKYGAKDYGDIYSYQSKKSLLPGGFGKKERHQDGWSITIQDHIPDDLFFTHSDTAFRMEKSQAFMKWKFDENPEQRFQWLTIRCNGELKGYVVFHVNRGRFRKAVNIHDWDLMPDVSDSILKKAVDVLRGLGNWISLWGRYDEKVLKRWRNAGIGEKGTQGTHFLLCPYGEKTLPEAWHLTRADLDF